MKQENRDKLKEQKDEYEFTIDDQKQEIVLLADQN